MVVSVSVVHPCDHGADWELWTVPTHLSSYVRASYHILLGRGKIKFKIESTISTECILLSHHLKVKKKSYVEPS